MCDIKDKTDCATTTQIGNTDFIEEPVIGTWYCQE